MKKSDLKSGMWFQLRYSDTKYMFISDPHSSISKVGDLGISKRGGCGMRYYDDNLRYIGDSDFDIIKIYAGDNHMNVGELLWEREKEVKELTMEQLEKDYGCKVKIIKQ